MTEDGMGGGAKVVAKPASKDAPGNCFERSPDGKYGFFALWNNDVGTSLRSKVLVYLPPVPLFIVKSSHFGSSL